MNYRLILFIEKCGLNSNVDVCIVYKRVEYIRAKLNITITIIIMIGIALHVYCYT